MVFYVRNWKSHQNEFGYKMHLKSEKFVQLIASFNAVSTEDCSVSQEQWQKEVQLEFKEQRESCCY